MKRLLTFSMLLCLLAITAQARVIKGVVVAGPEDEPLIGATVTPVGGGNGTATDIDGSFTLNVGDNVKLLTVTYIGYQTKEVAISDNRWPVRWLVCKSPSRRPTPVRRSRSSSVV